jgi:pimeloyl-ACP methyl ester carboxylesterase/quercetin dioxygenase-like cupin family protein
VKVDGAELHVEVTGAGRPLVFVHGLGLSGALWNRMRESFGAGYQFVLVDLRGAPRSRELEPTELTLARWAADLAEVVRTLGLDRPVLVGHSLGATIALEYALERPGEVGALVLLGTEANLSNLAPRMLAAAERIERDGLATWVDQVWSKNPPFARASLERDPSILAEYRARLLENDAVDYVRQCRAIASAESLADRLGAVRPPALVVVGSDDDRTPPARGRELARAIRRSRLVELRGVGHTMPLEAPRETAEAIGAFLRELPAPARVLRADATPRNPREGPFGHLDVRWVVGAHTGASLIAFGQSRYPFGATHENHYHPHAEEVVMVLAGRGTQIVGRERLDVGPGDICFIPRSTPHRITGTSEDEDLVIVWAFGGAASIEAAGYVSLPDDKEELDDE